jgi:tetratricopeptide (TPR) repeat protein
MLIKRRPVLFITIGLIIILGFAVYSNTLNNRFVWDDYSYVEGNTYIKNWSHIPKVFTEDIGACAGYKAYFYRPIQMITYMIDYSFWGLNVKGYHLTNIFLHILVALVIYWLINILYDNLLLSFLTSVLFVAHPIHTETVAFISGRTDSLAALFMLLCLVFYIKYLYLENAKIYILTFLSYILALLSKENSVILPILLLLYHYAFRKKIKINKFISILGITFVYVLLRVTILKSLLPDTPSLTTLFLKIPGFFAAITNYFRLILLPFDLHMGYGYTFFHFTYPQTIFGILILFLLLAYAFIKRKSDKLMFFSLLWFFVTLLPVSSIYPINDSYMYEHWLYFPSIGLFLILAEKFCFIYKIKRYRVFATFFMVSIVVFYSSLTIRQNEYWREPISFYERTLKYAPDSWRLYNELGLEYMNIGKTKEAIASYKKALEINPNLVGVYYNLGILYHNIGNTEEAIRIYKKALEIDSGYVQAYVNLGNIYYAIGNTEEAARLYKKALEVNPNFAIAHNNLALIYYYEKQYSLAIKHCDKARELGYKVHPQFLDFLKAYRK